MPVTTRPTARGSGDGTRPLLKGNPTMDCRIKICGVTREEDVALVSASGADYVGLLVNMPSARTLTPERAVELAALSGIPAILLFMGSPAELVAETARAARAAGVQIQGDEAPEFIASIRPLLDCEIWKGIHLPAEGSGDCDERAALDLMRLHAAAGADRLLLDTVSVEGGKRRMGGTGRVYDWDAAARIASLSPRPVFMAGGLNPDNVADAIRRVRPFGVDLAGGVESAPGIKDPEKVAAFVHAVRSAM